MQPCPAGRVGRADSSARALPATSFGAHRVRDLEGATAAPERTQADTVEEASFNALLGQRGRSCLLPLMTGFATAARALVPRSHTMPCSPSDRFCSLSPPLQGYFRPRCCARLPDLAVPRFTRRVRQSGNRRDDKGRGIRLVRTRRRRHRHCAAACGRARRRCRHERRAQHHLGGRRSR